MDYLLGFLETSSFAFCSYTFYRWQKSQSKLQDLISFVQKANIMTPTKLRLTMEENSPEDLKLNLRDFEEGRNYSRGFAFVQGIVESNQVIRSLLNHGTKLILSSVSSESIFSNNKNFEEVEGKIETKYVSEFSLGEPMNTNKVLLNNNRIIDFSDSLHLIHSIVHMRNLSPLEKFLSWVLFCIKLFLSMSNVGKKLSGFKVGSRRVERGIMVGQFMIAFGEVIFDRYNKELRMNNPLFFMKDKEQLLNKLIDKNNLKSRNMTLLFSIMVMIGVFLLKRVVKIAGNLVNSYQKHYRNKDMRGFFQLKEIYLDDFRCIDCRNSVRNIIYKPCLHLAACSRCYDLNVDKCCQICKSHIEGCVPIFNV